MSRDYELLQRLESGWEQSFHPLSGIEADQFPAERASKSGSIPTALCTYATRPLRHITAEIRNEIHKLVFRTFLSSLAYRTVVFTSVGKKSEAKWLTACAADVLAEVAQKRVCILDADLENPSVHHAYSVPNDKGLATVLREGCAICDAAIRVSDDLWVIPAGDPLNELIYPTISLFRSMLNALSYHFDYIVINAPDCERLTELCTVAAASEGAVLLLDAVTTHRTSAQEAKSALETSGTKVIGSVFYNQHSMMLNLFSARI
jgi:Mrp family chromosome partitioning ATPase